MKNLLLYGSIILGFLFLGGAEYINYQVKEGKTEIASVQKKLDTGSKISKWNPTTQAIDDKINEKAGEKIDEGEKQIAFYEKVSLTLKVMSIALFVCAGVLFYKRYYQKK